MVVENAVVEAVVNDDCVGAGADSGWCRECSW